MKFDRLILRLGIGLILIALFMFIFGGFTGNAFSVKGLSVFLLILYFFSVVILEMSREKFNKNAERNEHIDTVLENKDKIAIQKKEEEIVKEEEKEKDPEEQL